MKRLLPFLLLVFVIPKTSFCQSSLDGKNFSVTLFIQKEKDSNDTLMFQNNSLTFATAKKYGFVIESLKSKDKGGSTSFTAVFKSKKNGDMIWDGKVNGDNIEGTVIWDKLLQNPVNYTFTGSLLKNEEH